MSEGFLMIIFMAIAALGEVFLMMIFMAIAALGGFMIGSTYQAGQGRDRFLTYCTAKGDTYEACKNMWGAR